MSREVQRDVGELLAAQLDSLPDNITDQFVCGCFAEDLRFHEGVWWAYDRRFGGFHSPFEPHPTDEELAVRYLLTADGDGLGLA